MKAAAERTRTPDEWLVGQGLNRIGCLVAHRAGLRADDLEDFLQDLRLSVWRAGTKPIDAAWVFRAAEHCAIDIFRKRRREDRVAATLPAGHGNSDLELEQILRASVARLPESLQALYRTRLLEGFSERETARRIGVSRKKVRRMEAYLRRLLSRGH